MGALWPFRGGNRELGRREERDRLLRASRLDAWIGGTVAVALLLLSPVACTRHGGGEEVGVIDVPSDTPASGRVASGPTATPESSRPSPSAARPTGDDVSAVIRHIASIAPGDRYEAYQTLLDQGGPGYDEVFLVGLNEDDYAALEVVVSYFREHHPERAIEPLLDLLMYMQGDRAMREAIVGALERFGRPAIEPVVTRLKTESEGRLSGGARKGLEQALAGAVDRSDTAVLNRFLERAEPEWLLAYGVMGAERVDTPPVDAETFRVLARRLGAARDPRAVEGLLRLTARLARQQDLPGTVSLVVPVAARRLRGNSRRWALYALAMVADPRVSRQCRTLARQSPDDRFWVYQVLATSRGPLAMEALAKALGDPNEDIRAEAAFLLSLDPVGVAAEGLRRLLADDRTPVERPVVVALERLRDSEARPILEARLGDAPLDVQAEILKALLAVADSDLASALEGWTDLTLIAPARVGKISLDAGPGRDAFLSALLIIAADGGSEGRAYLSRLVRQLDGDAGRMAAGFVVLSRCLEKGLARTLEAVVLGDRGTDPPCLDEGQATVPAPGPGSGELGVTGAAGEAGWREISRQVRESLFLLCPRWADARTREVLEAILLQAPRYRDRLLAADALTALEDPASIPALRRALQDPWFRDGPYPLYRYPVRRAAARGLEAFGLRVDRCADRSFRVYSH